MFGGSSELLFKCLELFYVITNLVKSSIFFLILTNTQTAFLLVAVLAIQDTVHATHGICHSATSPEMSCL